MIVLDEPYLLSVCVPIKVDSNGTRWCNELWAKDLALHLEYLTNLTLACPRIFAEPVSTDQPLSLPPFDRITFIDLPSSRSYLGALSNFPELASKMWAGVKSAKIVHAGFGGWPVSEGWLAIPMGKLQKKFVISYVESSFWRVSDRHSKWHQRLRADLIERFNQFCVKIADLRFFTSKAYETDFLGPANHAAQRSYVTPAAWIDERSILTEAQVLSDQKKRSGAPRLLFAGRLVTDKGVKVLLDAIEHVRNDLALTITIIGEGGLSENCTRLEKENGDRRLKVEVLSPVPYGQTFFDLLRRFDAIVVPSISDEQPRLIFDAFSQGLPVLGSDTGGIAEVVDDEIDGKLCKPGDFLALANMLRWADQNKHQLQTMGLAGLHKSRKFTHRSMHERRSEIIAFERSALRS